MAKGRRKLAVPDSIKVAVRTPAAGHPVSRGFYQVEEDILYVPVCPDGKFYSFLDSPQIVLDIDNKGRLLFLQVLVSRHKWTVSNASEPSVGLETADIRFLSFREPIPKADLEVSPDYSRLHLIFDARAGTINYRVTDNLIFQLTEESTLASIWITSIQDDRAAQGMAAWRKQTKRELSRKTDDSPYERIEINRPPSGK